MSLIPCPECRRNISDTAGQCPNCGFKLTAEAISAAKEALSAAKEALSAAWEAKQRRLQFVFIGCSVASVCVVGLCAGVFSSIKPTHDQSLTVSNVGIGDTCTVKVTCWATKDRGAFDRVSSIMKSKDEEAYGNLVLSGDVIRVPAGTTVTVMDRTLLGPADVKVRIRGEADEVWMNSSWLQ